jgi:RNA recognition motif-containing protein
MSGDYTRKVSARKVYVGNLSLVTEWRSLKTFMELAGEVVRVEMIEDSKRNKNSALVMYSSNLEAQRAIQQLDGKELDKKFIEVREDTGPRRSRSPRKSNQIYIKNLPYSVTWQQLRDVFTPFGEVVRVDIPKDVNERSKGFGFVLFKNDGQAFSAIQSMNNAEFNGRKIIVKQAQKKHRKISLSLN